MSSTLKTFAIFGAGNLGTQCARELNAQGYECTLLPRDLDQIPKGLSADCLLHCAGPTGDFRTRVLDTFDAAVTATIELMRKIRPRRVVAVSSVRVYGFRSEPVAFDELAPVHTDHTSLDFAYDGAKQALENLMLHGAPELGIEGVVVRLSNLVGGAIRPGRAAMLHHALRDARGSSAPVETRQHLDSSKDYLHVSDAASGILLAALHGQRGDIYNIASGVALSVQDVAKRLGVRVLCTDANAHPTHSRIAINKAQTELGYRPHYADAGSVVAAIAEE